MERWSSVSTVEQFVELMFSDTCSQLLAPKVILSPKIPLLFPPLFARKLAGVKCMATCTAKNSCGSMVNKSFSIVDGGERKESVH